MLVICLVVYIFQTQKIKMFTSNNILQETFFFFLIKKSGQTFSFPSAQVIMRVWVWDTKSI